MGEVAGRDARGRGRAVGRRARLLVDDRRAARSSTSAWGDGFDEARWSTTRGGAFTVWYGRGGTHRRRAHPRARRRLRARPRAGRARGAAAVTLPAPARAARRASSSPRATRRRSSARASRALAAQRGVDRADVRGAARARPLHGRDRAEPRAAAARAGARACTWSTRRRAASATRAGSAWTSRARGCSRRPGRRADRHHRRRLRAPRPDWLRAQLDAVARGRAGDRRARRARRRRARRAAARGARAPRRRGARPARARRASARPARAEHHQFSGASIGVTAADLRARSARSSRARRSRTRASSGALRRHGVADPPARRRARDHVRRGATAARRRGLAVDLRRSRWLADAQLRRRAEFPLERAARRASATTVAVVLPAREVADTIGAVLDAIAPLERAGLVDEVLVVDAASRDGTARDRGRRAARAWPTSPSCCPSYGPALGKGDAMWRGLAATTGDIVAFLDTDTEDFHAGFVLGLLGPLLTRPGGRVRQGRVPAPAARRRHASCPTAAAASPSSSPARC